MKKHSVCEFSTVKKLKYDFISEIYQHKEKQRPPNFFSNCLIEINEDTVRLTKCGDETVVSCLKGLRLIFT